MQTHLYVAGGTDDGVAWSKHSIGVSHFVAPITGVALCDMGNKRKAFVVKVKSVSGRIDLRCQGKHRTFVDALAAGVFEASGDVRASG